MHTLRDKIIYQRLYVLDRRKLSNFNKHANKCDYDVSVTLLLIKKTIKMYFIKVYV